MTQTPQGSRGYPDMPIRKGMDERAPKTLACPVPNCPMQTHTINGPHEYCKACSAKVYRSYADYVG